MTDKHEEARKLFLEGLDFLLNGKFVIAEQRFLQANDLVPDRVSVLTNLSAALLKQGKIYESRKYVQRSVELDPGNVEGWINIGECLARESKFDEALAHYDRAIALEPKSVEALSNRGNILRALNRLDAALADYEKALELKPDMPYVPGTRLHTKMHLCDWSNWREEFDDINRAVAAGEAASTPFPLLATPASLALQRKCTEIYVGEKFPVPHKGSQEFETYKHDRIRLGYFSADFHAHATSYLMAELFEKHDRSKFELIAFSLGPPAADGMRARLEASFDRFIDVVDSSDVEISELASILEIDIAIDLKGFTQDARTGIFANRAAPVQVNYLGYPGTMGANFIDYLIADSLVLPEKDREYYSEKIVYLPDTYQVNDSTRNISGRAPGRSEVGLPDNGFVFCCFNNNYKITPDVFDVWMRLLHKMPGSVLWLFEGNPVASANLKMEAERRGISADRLLFAQRVGLADHLARHKLADIFLDTLYYNAHTTASDALWAGLPVITCLGETFAGRVAGSLLNAIGLPELITHSLDQYEALALELATSPEKLLAIRKKLELNRQTHPLFDTNRFTKNIERAFELMHERHQAGLAPAHIHITA